MKSVCNLNMCTGCMACAEICPKGAVKIKDTLYAYNAVIQEDICIDCGKCINTCPNNKSVDMRRPIKWYQGWANDELIRKNATSGGYATAVMTAFVKNGGIVYSCAFVDGEFKFSVAQSIEQIEQFVGSKYVKSNPSGIYKQIEEKLKLGKSVLFLGLPCQAAGLINYIKAPLNKNLFTVDIICHGTPSPKILDSYFIEHGVQKNEIKSISFRNNLNYQLLVDDKFVGMENVTDKYSLSFLKGCIFTENCYSCKYANSTRVTDLTLGDSWGSDLPTNELKKGVSLALCQTEKGCKLLDMAEICKFDVDIKKAIRSNSQLNRPIKKPKFRDLFISKLSEGKRFDKTVLRYLPKDSFKQTLKFFLIKFGFKKV